jgi:hypothetical protein
MLGSAEKVMVHGGENPAFGAVSGWRSLLALVAWTPCRWRRGRRPGTDRTRWRRGGAASTDGCSRRRRGVPCPGGGASARLRRAREVARPFALPLLHFGERSAFGAGDPGLVLGRHRARLRGAQPRARPAPGRPAPTLPRFGSDLSRLPPAVSIALGPIFARACLLMPLPATFLFGVAAGWVR